MSTTPTPSTPANTQVTLLVTGSANDQLSQFNVSFNGLTLTNQSGASVDILPQQGTEFLHLIQQGGEFIHLNGAAEPLAPVTVPQDTYTSATLKLGDYTGFACISQSPPGTGLQLSFFSTNIFPPTVTLPSPIAVSGDAMTLLLNLQVSQSATFSNCNLDDGTVFTITPTFSLKPLTLSSQPSNLLNGKENGVRGLVDSVGSSGRGFSLMTSDGAALAVSTGGNTIYQGISGYPALAIGMPVEADLTIQSGGSLQATRVEVEDTNVNSLSLTQGPILEVTNTEPVLFLYQRAQQGTLFNALLGGDDYFSFGNAIFQISAQFPNLSSLPFPATFSAANMVAGQNVFLTTHATTYSPGPIYVPASTITLISQTINGTVTAVSTSGEFTTYTVQLAPYDLFPQLAVQPGQTTLLSSPGTVFVYADSNTQLLNSAPLAPGSVLRFNGLVFNDSGTLRMDCAQIDDGIPE